MGTHRPEQRCPGNRTVGNFEGRYVVQQHSEQQLPVTAKKPRRGVECICVEPPTHKVATSSDSRQTMSVNLTRQSSLQSWTFLSPHVVCSVTSGCGHFTNLARLNTSRNSGNRYTSTCLQFRCSVFAIVPLSILLDISQTKVLQARATRDPKNDAQEGQQLSQLTSSRAPRTWVPGEGRRNVSDSYTGH